VLYSRSARAAGAFFSPLVAELTAALVI
jgi:hypothetical protein